MAKPAASVVAPVVPRCSLGRSIPPNARSKARPMAALLRRACSVATATRKVPRKSQGTTCVGASRAMAAAATEARMWIVLRASSARPGRGRSPPWEVAGCSNYRPPECRIRPTVILERGVASAGGRLAPLSMTERNTVGSAGLHGCGAALGCGGVRGTGAARGCSAARGCGGADALRLCVERLVHAGVLLHDLHVVARLCVRDALGEELLVTVLRERGPARDAMRAGVVG